MTPCPKGDRLLNARRGRGSRWSRLSGFSRAARHVAAVEEWPGGRPRAEADLRFLLDAGIKLAASLNLGETIQRVARSAVPYLGDLAVVDLQEHDNIRRAAVAHADESRQELAQTLAMLPETGELRSSIARAIRMRTPAWGECDSEHAQVLRELGIHGFLVVPLLVRDQVLGSLTVYAAAAERNYAARDVFTALELGRRAALAIENARLHAAAVQAVSLREELVNVASHDLKTPLSAIHLRAALLERRLAATGSPEVLEGLRGIVRTTRQMETLILDLLESANVTEGRLALAVRDEDLVRVSAEAVESVRPLALDSGLRLDVELPPAPLISRCDRGRILQVLSNILGNALKFTSPGGTIGLQLRSVGGRAIFRISDTGRGIDPEDLPVIFDRYRRARNSRDSAGYGLGLFIVKGILDAHGGQIQAESQLGTGTTFTFNLPQQVAEPLIPEMRSAPAR
jgi:signal transduction histidine kinase